MPVPGRSVPGRCLDVCQFDSDHAECVRCVPSRYHRAVDSQPNKTIFRRLEARGFSPSHVAEVGVYMPETSNVYDYIEAGVRATLVEPDVASIERIEARFGEYPAVTLHRVAAYDYEGELTLTQCEASTFASELDASPAIVNDGRTADDGEQFSVPCTTFDKIDDGTIDLISIDTEGSEWFVLKYMISRPQVISIETHGAAYLNPYLREISQWMEQNDYQPWYRDKSDTVYVRGATLAPGLGDRMALATKSVALIVRRARKRIVRQFSGG